MTISIPDMDSTGDVFKLHWSPENVLMQVDHLTEGDELRGEIIVSLNGNGKPQHLYQGRLNFLSVSGKKQFAEALKKRADLEWETMIEQACVKIIHAYRQGDPVVKLGNLPQRTKSRYRLFPWVMEDSMTCLYGFGGSCKSYIAAFVAVMIQTGIGKIGFNPIKGNVLILDWEACQEDWDERIKAIMIGMGFDSDELPIYKRCYRTLSSDILEIQKIVLENQIKFIVVDSVGMASDISDSFHGSAIQMLRAARSLKCSILLLDHKSKQNEMFGSVYKLNEVRSAFEIKNTQEEGSDTVCLAVEHTKINNGPKTTRIGLQIHFVGDNDFTDQAIFKRVNVADIPELANTLPLKQRIANELKRGHLGVALLAEALDESDDSIRTILNRNKDMFIKLLDGTWGLIHKEGQK